MAKWYCKIKGTILGPLSPEELRLMINKGKLRPRDRVSQTKDGEWLRAGDVDGLFSDEDLEEAEEEQARPSPKKPKLLKKSSRASYGDGYYSVLGKNMREGGTWLQRLIITGLVLAAITVGMTLWRMPRDASVGTALAPDVPAMLLSTVGLAIFLFLEAIALGVPFLAIDKDWTGLDILDVFARTYLYGCIAVLFVAAIYATDREAGAFFQLLVFSGGCIRLSRVYALEHEVMGRWFVEPGPVFAAPCDVLRLEFGVQLAACVLGA